MNEWLDDFRTAVAFLTRLPMPHPTARCPEFRPRPPDVSGCRRCHWRRVGLPLPRAARRGLPDLAAAALALGRERLLTGALHEDGLADVADGFGGGRDTAAKLEIMRDSRLGTYGALILLVSFAAKVSALAAIPDAHVVQA